MNNDFVLKIIKEISIQMPINEYKTSYSGTLKIAEAYIKATDGYSYIYKTPNKINIYYKKKLIGFINGQSPSTNEKKAIRVSNGKFQTEQLLIKNNVSTTNSHFFNESSYLEAKDLVNNSTEKLVVKPNRLSGGRGISLNVNSGNFDVAWNFASNACVEKNKKVEIIVQDQLEGIESRFIVINKKFESAILRVPANVIGDGKHTISELIDIKNKQRNKNPHLKRLPIQKDDQTESILRTQGKKLENIPFTNEVIFLRFSSNVSQGGDNFEISHLVNDEMKRLAELSVAAIPGLNTAGVDILYKSFDDKTPRVLEVNPAANLRMHHYPWKGKAKSPVHTLIESMKKNN